MGAWYRRQLPDGRICSITVIQRASSDLRLNPHFHTLFLDGVFVTVQSEVSDGSTAAPLFHPAPKPTEADIEFVLERTRKRILRYLEKHGVVTFAAAPGDEEVNAVLGEGFGEVDPAHATLLHAATKGASPAGPAQKRAPVRMPLAAAAVPEPKGFLCAQISAFNLHAARRVAPNDKQGMEILCRYILRPPLAKERLHLLENGSVTVEFKRPWSDGTRSIGLAPVALISRMAALVPPPKRHVTVYSGVLASNSRWRSLIVPKPAATEEEPESHPSEADAKDREAAPTAAASVKGDWGESKPKKRSSRYIPWHELLRRTFGKEVLSGLWRDAQETLPRSVSKTCLIALVKKECSCAYGAARRGCVDVIVRYCANITRSPRSSKYRSNSTFSMSP